MERYVVAIDQSTSASKVLLLDSCGKIARSFAQKHHQYYPKQGFVEHDVEEIWRIVLEGVKSVTEGLASKQIAALGVSNQRETTVLWSRKTGRPLCHAIVWQDVRAQGLCEEMREHAPLVERSTGLRLSAYYPAAKAASVLREHPEYCTDGLCVGTMDSYLVFRLTGRFLTDVSNASRTELFRIADLCWADELCKIFGVPQGALAEVLPSDGDFGYTNVEGLPRGIPVAAVMGDSHAALFGQGCLKGGMAKATFGTGSSVMVNVGEQIVPSRNGLSSSVGFGFRGKTCYVLEGNVTCCGDALCWLRDEAGLISDIAEVEALSRTVPDAGGVTFVPAFSGLGAPYFDEHARGAIVGLNRGTTRAQIVRAALESMAYQDAVILDAMASDLGRGLSELRVDGGPAGNSLLMQTLADLSGCPVRGTIDSELSALGAGYMAGIRTGVYSDAILTPTVAGDVWTPAISQTQRMQQMENWHAAVARCR